MIPMNSPAELIGIVCFKETGLPETHSFSVIVNVWKHSS